MLVLCQFFIPQSVFKWNFGIAAVAILEENCKKNWGGHFRIRFCWPNYFVFLNFSRIPTLTNNWSSEFDLITLWPYRIYRSAASSNNFYQGWCPGDEQRFFTLTSCSIRPHMFLLDQLSCLISIKWIHEIETESRYSHKSYWFKKQHS